MNAILAPFFVVVVRTYLLASRWKTQKGARALIARVASPRPALALIDRPPGGSPVFLGWYTSRGPPRGRSPSKDGTRADSAKKITVFGWAYYTGNVAGSLGKDKMYQILSWLRTYYHPRTGRTRNTAQKAGVRGRPRGWCCRRPGEARIRGAFLGVPYRQKCPPSVREDFQLSHVQHNFKRVVLPSKGELF